MKAELVADERYPNVVFYERVVEDLSDTDNLRSFWKYFTDTLGSRLCREIEGYVCTGCKMERKRHYDKNHQLVDYTMRDLTYHDRSFVLSYNVRVDNLKHYNSGVNPFEVMLSRVVKEYMKGDVTESDRVDTPYSISINTQFNIYS